MSSSSTIFQTSALAIFLYILGIVCRDGKRIFMNKMVEVEKWVNLKLDFYSAIVFANPKLNPTNGRGLWPPFCDPIDPPKIDKISMTMPLILF